MIILNLKLYNCECFIIYYECVEWYYDEHNIWKWNDAYKCSLNLALNLFHKNINLILQHPSMERRRTFVMQMSPYFHSNCWMSMLKGRPLTVLSFYVIRKNLDWYCIFVVTYKLFVVSNILYLKNLWQTRGCTFVKLW